METISNTHLPRWRGFNLLEKFTLDGNAPYQEWDFDFIARNSFDFVRLPTDYRIWTTQPGQYLEKPLKEIDQAVDWGRTRGIHISLNLHRVPGYCVNPPLEALDLWGAGSSGEEARKEFADQWRMFAARYHGIPSTNLSFNLVNEPGDITSEQYLRAISPAVEAIRKEDPNRLILADGIQWGNTPVSELGVLNIAESMHCYVPMQLTHYRANWVEGSTQWPIPTWPIQASINQYLYGNIKAEYQRPLTLDIYLPEKAQLGILVNMVSDHANLIIKADGQTLYTKLFQPGPGNGEWKSSEFKPEWNIYQAFYDQWYTTEIPVGRHTITLQVDQGDWLTFTKIRISPFAGASGNQVLLQPGSMDWGVPQEASFTIDSQGNLISDTKNTFFDKSTLKHQQVDPWVQLMQRNIGVHIGEWGAYSYTPHPVVLAWMKDCLALWKQAGMGWALWNLRGGFGVLDSDRADVVYENEEGHQLDRAMLELLKQG